MANPRLAPVKDPTSDQNFRLLQRSVANLAMSTGPVLRLRPGGDVEFNQAVINKAAGVQPVYAPAGEYVLPLSIPSNTTLIGSGPQTIFKFPEAATFPYGITNVDHTNGNSNIHLSDFAIDGNKEGQTTAEVLIEIICNDAFRNDSVAIERIYAHDSNGLGIVHANSRRFAVRDCIVANNDRDGITVYENTSNGVISGNQIIGCNDDSIGLNSENGKSEGHLLEDINVSNNVIIGPAANKGSYGAIHARGGQNIAIVGNVIDSVKQFGIVAEDYNKTGVGGLLIASNALKLVGEEGENERPAISLYAGLNGEGAVRDVTIIGNHIREPATYGIFLQNLKGGSAPVEGINVSGNFIDHAGNSGIHLADAVIKDTKITGNLIHDCAEKGIAAITATTNLQRIWCNDNVLYNNGVAGIWLQKVVGGSCVGNSSSNQVASAPQEYGIVLKEVAGNWSRGANLAFNNEVQDYDYEMSGASIATITN